MTGLAPQVRSGFMPVDRSNHLVTQPSVVPMTGEHALGVRTLLSAPLEDLYPGSRQWLSSKLRHVAVGAAWGFAAFDVAGALVGVTLATVKPHGPVKINTLYVSDSARCAGIGSGLLAAALAGVDRSRASESYITVAHHIAADLERVLLPAGFAKTARVDDRYGIGRHEVVYTRLAALTPPLQNMSRDGVGAWRLAAR